MKQKNYFSIVRATLLVLLGMLLVPSSLRAKTNTITYDFAAFAASQQYYAGNTSVSMGASYSGITGAKVGNTVTYRPSNTTTVDISRVAFYYNPEGNADGAYDITNKGGFYFYAERQPSANWYRGLYTGAWGYQLAVLNLKPGDVVKITYAGSTNVDLDSDKKENGNIHVDGYGWGTQIGKYKTASVTVNITVLKDLLISVNKGTMIQEIEIESSIAEYEIIEDKANKTSSFEFTAPGLMDQNSFTVEYLKADFGNADDYLVVQNTGSLQSSMYNKNTGSENLVTDGSQNWRPTGGNYYAFTPTASGQITVNGGMHGTCIHLFVYDIKTDSWDTDGTHHYKQTWNQNDSHIHDLTFSVTKGKIYYICQDNTNETERNNENAFHLHKFTYVRSFNIKQLGVVVDNVDAITGDIALTQIENPGGTGGQSVTLKRCTGNITTFGLSAYINQYGWLYMTKPTFADGTDHAGTVILDVVTDNGEGTVVVTFPYHANFGVDPTNPNRTLGHTWNFIDPRNSDSNFGNCLYKEGQSSYLNGETSGILSIGQYKNTNSLFYRETENREWAWSRRVQGTNGTIHDPYYMNTYDMVGDNADMIWETEGLVFNTGTNLSIIYNESDAYDQRLTNPVDFVNELNSDPDRYVGLLPDADGQSSFTIPSLKDGDRVLIFMKSGIKMSDDDADHGIFLKVHGAKDALGKSINPNDLYKAGGTNYDGRGNHKRYEGCYHFIKEGNGDMTFEMVGGSMCKLLYVRIYTGDRIDTNDVLANKTVDGVTQGGNLLFINDKGATEGDGATLSLHYNGKVQHSAFEVLTYSGNLNENDDSFTGENFKQSGTYEEKLDFKSKVGEIGMFRLRAKDLEFNKKYVADFSDRNFTVGYRDKVDSYPYTWDFTDIQGFSSPAMSAEANKYPIDEASNDVYGNEWDISLFDENGYMKLNTGFKELSHNHIFDSHKIGFGNQLWAGSGVIPETKGLWFYTDDNDPLYNDCLQITQGGIRFCNTAAVEGHKPWWNYKMVVPDVPADGAVYLRMKRDQSVAETDKMDSEQDGKPVLFLNTRFHFGTNPKTSLTEDGQNVYLTQENGSNYSFYQVPGTTDEYILAIKNTTGETNHLTFTLNGWIVKKLAVSTDGKKVNDLGYTTESRNHAIDHSLTSFFSGGAFTTYIVTGADEETLSVTAEPVTTSTPVLPANTGCFIQNTNQVAENDYQYKVFDHSTDQFHLFAPDMHDTEKLMGVTYNMMRPMPAEGVGRTSTENGKTYYNYVMTSNWVSVNPETGEVNPNGPTSEGKAKVEGFYRIVAGQTATGTNKAYLPIEQSTVNNAPAAYFLNLVPTAVDPEEPLSEDYGNQDVDAISLQNAADVDAVWYNMNGQKLNGKPAKSGVYIMNGRKVVIK